MRIYTRAEWNARPPTKVMPHCRKRYIIIHHTASGNGAMNVAADLRYQYNCQGWHISEYDATDILQGFGVFGDGVIVEGRMPWDSDNGAIYNWGGGAVDGVGIECDGTFYAPGVYMGEVQYRSLVWLCAEIVKRDNVDTRQPRWIFGHREIYPCRPGDPKSTACPGNLLGQFVTNGKLQRDVLELLSGVPAKQEEEDGMFYERPSGKRFVFINCYRDRYNYYVTTDGPATNLRFRLECRGDSKEKGDLQTTDPQNVSGLRDDHNLQDILKQDRMKGVKGSFKLTITSDTPIDCGLREVPK